MEHTESYSGSAGVKTEQTEVGGDPNTFGHAAQDVTADARKRGQEVLDKVADEAQTLVGRLQGEATGALGEGKTQLATQIGGVARALKASSQEFRHDSLTGLANFSEGLANEVEAVQHYLDDRSGETLLRDFRSFASRHRGLFVGSLFVAGLVAVRFSQSAPSQGAPSEVPPRSRGNARTTVVTKRRVRTFRSERS